jgi:hypothetical protein
MRWELVGTRVLGPRHVCNVGEVYSKDAVVGGGGSEEIWLQCFNLLECTADLLLPLLLTILALLY